VEWSPQDSGRAFSAPGKTQRGGGPLRLGRKGGGGLSLAMAGTTTKVIKYYLKGGRGKEICAKEKEKARGIPCEGKSPQVVPEVLVLKRGKLLQRKGQE